MNHGNSIGNGAIIAALPPDESPKKKKHNESSFNDYGYNKSSSILAPSTLGNNSLQKNPNGDYVFKKAPVPRSILVPSSWSNKKGFRPVSPIEYDFRGRRVTPKKAQPQTEVKKLAPNRVLGHTRNGSMASSTYTPGKYAAKVSVKQLIGQ